MKALIDGDILRYEVGFAAQAGWKVITDRDEIPPFHYVQDLLHLRVSQILTVTEATDYEIFLTEGRTFRYDIGVTKPYKGQRVDNKPWHFDNLTIYMRDVLPTRIVTHIEADDAMAIEQLSQETQSTIICSRDKDLRQIPGWVYSWELGAQPSFGPQVVNEVGYVSLSQDRKTLTGTGFAFFCGQLLVGDTADNIPGLPRCGPVAAYEGIRDLRSVEHLMEQVEFMYQEKMGDGWEDYLLEQGQLLWIVRRLTEDGSPVIWERGMYT